MVGAAHLGVRPPVSVGGAGAAVFSNLSVRDPQLQRLSLILANLSLCSLQVSSTHRPQLPHRQTLATVRECDFITTRLI